MSWHLGLAETIIILDSIFFLVSVALIWKHARKNFRLMSEIRDALTHKEGLPIADRLKQQQPVVSWKGKR
jgi:hypothetical protein